MRMAFIGGVFAAAAAILGACAGSSRMGSIEELTRPSGQLRGTVNYKQRIALVPGAVINIKLVDASAADAPAITIAEQNIAHTGQVPVPFLVRYDAGSIRARRRYELQARIEIDGKLRWINTTAVPVLSEGAPMDQVEVWVEMVSGR